MSRLFVVEGDVHAERMSTWPSLADARAELERLASIPWDEAPNRCPCESWRACGRQYQIIELDTADGRWREVGRERVLDVGPRGAKWLR